MNNQEEAPIIKMKNGFHMTASSPYPYIHFVIEKQREKKDDFYTWKDDLGNREESQHNIHCCCSGGLSHVIGYSSLDAVSKAKNKVCLLICLLIK